MPETDGSLLGNIFPQQKNDKFFCEDSCCQHDSQRPAVERMDVELMREEDPTEE